MEILERDNFLERNNKKLYRDENCKERNLERKEVRKGICWRDISRRKKMSIRRKSSF